MCPLSYGKFMHCFKFFFPGKNKNIPKATTARKNIPKATTARKKKTPLCILAQCLACLECFVVQSLSHVQLFATPWTAGCQAFLSFTISQSLLKLMSIELVMPSNHLILCCPLLLLPSILPRIRVFLMSRLFASGGPSIGASASVSVLLMNVQA